MNELIAMLECAPASKEQEKFLEAHADMLCGLRSADDALRLMRESLLDWCESQVNCESFEISTLDGGVLLTHSYSGIEKRYSWQEFPETALNLINHCKYKNSKAIKEFVEGMK